MSLTVLFFPLALLLMLVPVALALVVLVLLWRLLVHGSVRPPTPQGVSPSRALTWVYLGASVLVGLVLLALCVPFVADSSGDSQTAGSWARAWATLALTAPPLGAAVLASSRSARRTGTIRSASLDAREPDLTRWTWVRIWTGPVVTGLVALFCGVVLTRLPLPRTTLRDGSSAVVAGLQAPAGWHLVLGLLAVMAVSGLGSAAVTLIRRRPAPESGWDPRSALVNWCCAICCLPGGAWSVDLLLGTAQSGGGDMAGTTALSTALQFAAGIIGVGLLVCLLPRQVFAHEPVGV